MTKTKAQMRGVETATLAALCRKDSTVADVVWKLGLNCGHATTRRAVATNAQPTGSDAAGCADMLILFSAAPRTVKCGTCDYERRIAESKARAEHATWLTERAIADAVRSEAR